MPHIFYIVNLTCYTSIILLTVSVINVIVLDTNESSIWKSECKLHNYTDAQQPNRKYYNLYRNITFLGKPFAIVNPINFRSVHVTEFYLIRFFGSRNYVESNRTYVYVSTCTHKRTLECVCVCNRTWIIEWSTFGGRKSYLCG